MYTKDNMKVKDMLKHLSQYDEGEGVGKVPVFENMFNNIRYLLGHYITEKTKELDDPDDMDELKKIAKDLEEMDLKDFLYTTERDMKINDILDES